MVILAADTSTSYCSVALCRDTRTLCETQTDADRAHSEQLLETVDWVLGRAGLSLSQVDLFAISAGPGSFTGLRIGVATWKGLALAAQRPLMGVPTLDAMARLLPLGDGMVCPLLDAKMGEVYGAVYRYQAGHRSTVKAPFVGGLAEALEDTDEATVFLGEGAERYREAIVEERPRARFAPAASGAPRGSAVAAEAFHRVKAGLPARAEEVRPVYLRQSQAEELRRKAQSEIKT